MHSARFLKAFGDLYGSHVSGNVADRPLDAPEIDMSIIQIS